MGARRDYGLLREDGKSPVERGLPNGQWYRALVPPKRMKGLLQRSDGRMHRHVLQAAE